MNTSPASSGQSQQKPRESFLIVFLVTALLIAPATITLYTVAHPGVLVVSAENPTPLGYTVSLSLFLVPLAALGWWFARRADLGLQRQAFWRTILVLAPLGAGLDLLFGNTFFTFPNHLATLGIPVPALGGPIPVEEFLFYLTGFMVVLLSYIWGDEYWVSAYNIPDYSTAARGIGRLMRFHLASVLLGAGLLSAAILYKKLLAPSPEGFPWYFTYLVVASIVPSVGFFRTAQPFINWRAFAFTFFFILLVSLLWEATLAVPYGWWGYHPRAMIGLDVGAWSQLPVEAVCVWLAVTYTTVITYEVIKIWKALGTKAREAFFGIGK